MKINIKIPFHTDLFWLDGCHLSQTVTGTLLNSLLINK